ncbi:MAG: c-type cytochrome domain-containing protein [Rhodothermales bacterium]
MCTIAPAEQVQAEHLSSLSDASDFSSHSLNLFQEAEEESNAPLLSKLLNIDADNPPDFLVFIGRFHPLLVHLPISFLLLGGLLEVLSRMKRYSELRPSVSFVLFLGALSAVFAVIVGLLLSITGDYGGDDLWWHKWMGIGVAVTAVAAYWLKKRSIKTEDINVRRAYAGVLATSAAMLVVASHFGGSLTHGSDYLTSYMPEPFRSIAGIPPRDEVKPIVLENVDEAQVFSDIIHPILDARCASCHNPKKKKGDLILTTESDILAGGESGEVFISGNADDSELYRRLILDEDHDDHMPPSGRKPLSNDHINLIGWWISEGAPFDASTVAQVGTSDEVRDILDRMASEAQAAAFAVQVPPADEDALQALSALGVLVMPLSQETNLLQATFLNVSDEFSDDDLQLLAPVSEQIAWLNLGRSSVTDAGMTHLKSLKNLSKLHLEKTAVTDDGLAHLSNLERLEYLNLYGTAVSDNGLEHLKTLTNLSALYLWQSSATKAGAEKLQAAIPGLDINLGYEFTSTEEAEEAASDTQSLD